MPAPSFIPLTISWNLTKRCNLKCAHCYIEADARADRTGELSADEALGVLEQIGEVNSQAVLILTGGEPLLRKDIYDLIGRAAQMGFWTVLGSHGGMLTDAVAGKLASAGLRGVGVSVDSVDAAKHNQFRGIPKAWENTVAAIGVMRERELPFLVETTVTRFNRGELADMAAFSYERGATALNVFFLVPTGRGASLNDLTPSMYEDTLIDLAALQEQYAGKLLVNAKCAPHYRRVLWERDRESTFVRTFHGGGCPAGTYYCRITPEGDVTPCPYMPLPVGNVRETPFAELWRESPVLREFREAARSGRCGSCEFSEMCGGCRCRAFATTGDYLAEDPSCTYQPGTHGGVQIPLPPDRTYGADSDAMMGAAASPGDSGGASGAVAGGPGGPPADAASAADGPLAWTEGAEARLRNVPFFARGMVRRAVEGAARRRGVTVVTEEVMTEIREAMKGRFPMRGRN